TVAVILPSIFVGSLLVREAAAAYTRVQEAVRQGEVLRLVEQVRASRLGGVWLYVAPAFEQFSVELSDLLLRAMNWLSEQIVGQATSLARNLLVSVVNFGLMLVALFVFLGFLTGLASFLPLAGPAFLWSGTAIYLAVTGHLGRATGLAIWGVLAVSTADNWIKPLFISGRANLPTFLLLFAILGGLQVYGFVGVFLGPVILAILFSFVEIYREQYRPPAAAA